jgi:hypothetical protein
MPTTMATTTAARMPLSSDVLSIGASGAIGVGYGSCAGPTDTKVAADELP